MKNNIRVKVIVSSLAVLLPMFAGLALWNSLPELMTTHWGINGKADGFAGRGFTVFVLPLILLASHWLCIFVTMKDPKNAGQKNKALDLIFWIIPIVSCVTSAMVYSAAFGREWNQSVFLLVFLGLLFIVIGNYLPKCRQNYTMGIKVPWALNNEENWNATHRFGGRVWVAGGFLFILASFLPEKSLPVVMVLLILVLALVPTLYSWLYYKKQLRAGTAGREDASFVPKGANKKLVYGGLIFAAVIMIGAAVLMVTGDFELIFNEESFTVKADYWSDLTVEYAAIESVEFAEKTESALRVNGFGSAKLGMGMFENESLGRHTRYCYLSCDSAVIMQVQGKTLVINGRDDAQTEDIYKAILEKTS